MAEVSPLAGKRILLIVGGGIAAYKTLELIRRLKERGAAVRCILTAGGAQFVTALSASALSEDKVYTSLFDLTAEAEMGHIQLSRDADLLVVAPATADLLAKMTAGLADDLASTALLATDKPVLAAPAMNVRMWTHPATVENVGRLAGRGVSFVGPGDGPMACGEFGPGRLAEPPEILAAIEAMLTPGPRRLAGRRALVTTGPTHEPIDPVRVIANRSSGRQGVAIAEALAAQGAEVTLVSGPTALADPPGMRVVRIETAEQMLAASLAALPADIAVCAAAVADWRPRDVGTTKIKKGEGPPPTLALVPNPDILATLSTDPRRPSLVIGFAAETEEVVARGRQKRERKGCDWILANQVGGDTGTFGGADNQIHLVTADGVEDWPRMAKTDVGKRLAESISNWFDR